jgi:hypothetical protein
MKVEKEIGGFKFGLNLKPHDTGTPIIGNNDIVGDVIVVCEELDYYKCFQNIIAKDFTLSIIGIEKELNQYVDSLK